MRTWWTGRDGRQAGRHEADRGTPMPGTAGPGSPPPSAPDRPTAGGPPHTLPPSERRDRSGPGAPQFGVWEDTERGGAAPAGEAWAPRTPFTPGDFAPAPVVLTPASVGRGYEPPAFEDPSYGMPVTPDGGTNHPGPRAIGAWDEPAVIAGVTFVQPGDAGSLGTKSFDWSGPDRADDDGEPGRSTVEAGEDDGEDTAPALKPPGRFAPRVRATDLMQFSRQLSAFIRAGIPILDALSLLERDTENPTLRYTIADLGAKLRAGESLSSAIEAHPKVFPTAYRSMVRSAELTGNLDAVLDRISRYLERDVEARSRIQSASVYPAVILLMSVGVVILMATFVLPKFRPFFASFHEQLPLPTRMLLGAAAFIEGWWWAVLAGGAALIAAAVAWYRSDAGRRRADTWLLRVPLIGQTVRYSMVERFCRILASMMRAGVTLPEAMTVATEATRNRFVQLILIDAREAMLRGEGIAGPLAGAGFLPPAATQMLRVGEDTGFLDEQLEAAASYYERELDYRIKKLTSLFEPAILVVVGLVVGFVSLALVEAMYGVFHNAGVK